MVLPFCGGGKYLGGVFLEQEERGAEVVYHSERRALLSLPPLVPVWNGAWHGGGVAVGDEEVGN